MQIYPSIVTTGKTWQEQIQDIDRLGLKEVCFFPTTVDFSQRQELYQQIEQSPIKSIPLVHLRHDFRESELEYFIQQYKTQAFNMHLTSVYPLEHDLSQYYSMIYLENSWELPLNRVELSKLAGFCLDVTHLENSRRQDPPMYNTNVQLLGEYHCGCGHVGPVAAEPAFCKRSGRLYCDSHSWTDLSQFDYVKQYKKWLPSLLALELENPIEDQLKAKEYLEKILNE